MKKRMLGLFMVLALCLGLLPGTALAAGGIELYVSGQLITESGCYENQNGTWTKVGDTEPASGQFYYDGSGTLTLNEAEITNDQYVTVAEGYTYDGSVIAFSQTADVSLKIVVSQGTSTITGTGGIRVESTTGNASLSIKGPGSLDVEPKGSNSGITLSSLKNVNLDIDGADVTASSPSQYGVYLLSDTAASTSTITVNNGTLTTGGNGYVGIYYYWFDTNNAGTSSLTVSGNAVVDTRNSRIMTSNSGTGVQVDAGSDGSGGIVFNGKNGTVYGKVELQEDLEIGTDETLTIGEDASLTVPEGTTLTNNGTITNNGTVTVEEGGALTNQGNLDCNHHTGGTATCTEKAKCDLCGAEYGDFLPHTLTKTEAKAPTCTQAGNEAYWTCENCGTYFSDANGNTEIEKDSWILDPIDHDWNDAVYTWSDDGSTCTAARTCKHDSTHTETSTATVTAVQTKAPTCTEKGETTYTATFEADWAVAQTKVLADIPATGHTLTKTEAKAPTCTQAGNEAYWTCENCGTYFSDANGNTEIEKDSWILDPIDHDWNDAVYTWSDDGSTCTATRTCKHDSTHTETSTATITGTQTKAPTCTEKGETTYTATFEADWAVAQTKVLADIPATGHTLTKTEAKEATCTVAGNQAYWTCDTCGKLFADAQAQTETTLENTVIPAQGHDYQNGVCTVCSGKDPQYTPEPSSPPTGDTAQSMGWITLLAAAAATLLTMGYAKRKAQR